MLEITFKELNADDQRRHSVDLQPDARTASNSPSSKTLASSGLRDGFQNKIKNRP
jgi:hypothetical protein